MAWFVGGCVLAVTLRRLVHETGVYEETRVEAVSAGLVKVSGDKGWGRAGLEAPPALAMAA